MTITARVIADSVSPQGIRLTTLQLRYPKFIHGEAKTHRQIRISDLAYELLEEVGFMDDRDLSRNASSSRAIPVERLIQDVIDDPVVPLVWFKNKKGMQGTEVVSDSECERLIAEWLDARDYAVSSARRMLECGAHKQHINRVIEPFCHINVAVTATEWSNFFALRDHEDAQPEMRALAQEMRAAMLLSEPVLLRPGEWHLPYVNGDPAALLTQEEAIKVSVARCARVSYLTQEGKEPQITDDLALYDRLVGAVPLHASPAEHQATPDELLVVDVWARPYLHGNLRGWVQYRKTLPGECQ